MQTAPRLRTPRASLAAFLLVLVAGAFAFGDQPEQKQGDTTAKAAAPKEQSANDATPAAAPNVNANVPPDAKQLIDQVDAAYSKLQRLELGGTYTTDIDASGQKTNEKRNFTALFSAPGKYRHQMQDDIVVGSAGDKAYAFLEGRKLYQQYDAPKDKPSIGQVPEPIVRALQMQNPSLMLAVVKSPGAELAAMFTDIKKVADSKLDDASYPTLELTLPNKMVVTMLFHPQTHLLRQARTNVKPMLEERGTPDVKSATMVVDYTTVKADGDAAVKEEQFAWAPPQGAKDLADVPAGGGGGDRPASELEGKPAPEFAIQDMNDKPVSLKELRGKVVVLDMWATWCPPCRASLPHLDKLYDETKDRGVAIYAVNLQEDKDDVQNFIKQTNLKTPVLLDKDGKVAEAYKASAIPQTVVIGKDGNVAKVFIGFNPEQSPQKLKEAVEQAQK